MYGSEQPVASIRLVPRAIRAGATVRRASLSPAPKQPEAVRSELPNFSETRNVGCMEAAGTGREPDNGSGRGDTSGQSPAASSSTAVAAPSAEAPDAEGIQLPVWSKVLGWCGTAGLVYLLICAVNIISRGFAGWAATQRTACSRLLRTPGSD